LRGFYDQSRVKGPEIKFAEPSPDEPFRMNSYTRCETGAKDSLDKLKAFGPRVTFVTSHPESVKDIITQKLAEFGLDGFEVWCTGDIPTGIFVKQKIGDLNGDRIAENFCWPQCLQSRGSPSNPIPEIQGITKHHPMKIYNNILVNQFFNKTHYIGGSINYYYCYIL